MLPPDDRFTIDWGHAFRRNAARWLWDLRRRPLTYLELGLHEARSACWMLEYVLLHPASRCIALDHWNGSPGVPPAEARARRNLAPFARQVTIIKGRVQDVLAAGAIPPASIDVCYVDADHTADAVLTLSRLV